MFGQSAATLYKLNPLTKQVTVVGDFQGCPTGVIDIALDKNGKMFGNYTACALLKQVPPPERKAFAREYGLNCDSI